MADKLLPCPFCGGEARILTDMQDTTTPVFSVVCDECESITYFGDVLDKEGTVEAWNNRTSPWHTGTPTEYGWYLVAYRKRDCDGSFYWDYGTRVWEDYGEYGHWNITSMKYPVIKWQKINELVGED